MATHAAFLPDDEVRTGIVVLDRHHLAQQPYREALARVEILLLAAEDLVAAVEKDRGEEEQDEGEAVDHRDTERQEHRAEDQCADDAEEKHPVLIFPGHLEIREDQREDEEVVDREALLQQPGGRVLRSGGASERQEDDRAEDQREAHPQRAPQPGLLEADDMRLAVCQEVDRQRDDDGHDEHDPEPHRYVHAGLLTLGSYECDPPVPLPPAEGRPARTVAERSSEPKPVTAYPLHGARTTSPVARGSASVAYGAARPSGEPSPRSGPMTARRPSGVPWVIRGTRRGTSSTSPSASWPDPGRDGAPPKERRGCSGTGRAAGPRSGPGAAPRSPHAVRPSG